MDLSCSLLQERGFVWVTSWEEAPGHPADSLVCSLSVMFGRVFASLPKRLPTSSPGTHQPNKGESLTTQSAESMKTVQ